MFSLVQEDPYRRQSQRIKQRQQDILSIREICLREYKRSEDEKETLMKDLKNVVIAILPETIGVAVRQLLDTFDAAPLEHCPTKPAMSKKNPKFKQNMKPYEQKKKQYEECVKMRNDMKSHIEETVRRAVHKHFNERLAMASVRLLMGAKSECVDFSNRDALNFFQCQVQLSQVCLNYFAEKEREHDHFFFQPVPFFTLNVPWLKPKNRFPLRCCIDWISDAPTFIGLSLKDRC